MSEVSWSTFNEQNGPFLVRIHRAAIRMTFRRRYNRFMLEGSRVIVGSSTAIAAAVAHRSTPRAWLRG
jgi:hypothetical protein